MYDMYCRRMSGKRVHGRPTGGKILSESKLVLNPNGSCCADVKVRNSGGRSVLSNAGAVSSLRSCSLTVRLVVVGVFLEKFKEQEGLNVVEMNKVRRFEDNRRKRNKRFIDIEFALRGESMVDLD